LEAAVSSLFAPRDSCEAGLPYLLRRASRPCLRARGGKIYQALREPALSLHPNSLLSQMAEDQKDDKPIFVEGRWALMGATMDGL